MSNVFCIGSSFAHCLSLLPLAQISTKLQRFCFFILSDLFFNMVAGDFGPLNGSDSLLDDVTQNSSKTDGSRKREWLKVFETLPAQMLNAYGAAKYPKLSDATVWDAFNQPLKTGALYMTELCSKDIERRGVGINRMLQALKTFCEHQQDTSVRAQNEALFKEQMFNEIYAEIDRILPSLNYCLAPKKESEKKGSSTLRANSMQTIVKSAKSDTELDRHAAVIYSWLDTGKPSRIRMLLHWQSALGLSYVASVHHRAAQCFKFHGNRYHSDTDFTVSLSAFQDAIKSRHRVGDNGLQAVEETGPSLDFGKLGA